MKSCIKRVAFAAVMAVGLGTAACMPPLPEADPEQPYQPEEPIKLRIGGSMNTTVGAGSGSGVR